MLPRGALAGGRLARVVALALITASGLGACSTSPTTPDAMSTTPGKMLASASQPITLTEQGSFAVGGKVVTSPGKYTQYPEVTKKDSNAFWDVYKDSVKAGGQTLHGDHASIFYQIPANPKKYPLVFLHGAGQSARTWQTTPDGREGFQNIFLRQGFPVYLVDQPRRGQAGRTTVAPAMPLDTPDDQFWYAQFRIGVWPERFRGVAFPEDRAAQEQFFRQMTPDTGPFDAGVITDSMVKLFERTGDAIFVTHSAGGVIGWLTALASPKVKGIVAFEPGAFPFPEGEAPSTIRNRFGDVAPITVPAARFKAITRVPILIYFGDFIPEQPTGEQGADQWHARLTIARQWAEVVNRHGGNVKVVRLPDEGIRGNTHFPMSDLNSAEVARHMAAWLKQEKLD
ncbi:MAG: alpha/beta fold hydrolase [Lautropia sp.]|nr:alpha/beta fold hydrolase [Lautropia sp.]